MGDPMRAPQHVVSLIAAIAAPPQRGPTGEPTDAQWAADIRRIADAVWSEAWHTGATYQASVQARPILLAPSKLIGLCGGCGLPVYDDQSYVVSRDGSDEGVWHVRRPAGGGPLDVCGTPAGGRA